jgi:hypothetical protein
LLFRARLPVIDGVNDEGNADALAEGKLGQGHDRIKLTHGFYSSIRSAAHQA